MDIDPPYASDGPSLISDWLELVALLSRDKAARLDEFSDASDIGEDVEAEDIGNDDLEHECMIENITEELRNRRNDLGENAYPYEISPNGEILRLKQNLTYGQHSYLACLVIHHSWKTGKLLVPLKLTEEELRTARGEFEVLTAVAAVGFAQGPSFLIGTNREGAQGLLTRISKVCEVVREGQARTSPDPAAPISANDNGVDVIAVEIESNGPPHRCFWLCQSAAGANFVDKPIKNLVKSFTDLWFSTPPSSARGAIFLPAALDENDARYQTGRLGHLCHRLRLPRYAQIGFEMITTGEDYIFFVDDKNSPINWLASYFGRLNLEAI